MIQDATIQFDFTLFHQDESRPAAQARYLALLEELVRLDLEYLAEHPDTPAVYESGVTARTMALIERHHFMDIGTALGRRAVCIDALAAWRCAELRRAGKDAKLCLKVTPMLHGGAWLHLTILLPDGTIEDPFKLAARDKLTSVILDEFKRES